MFLENPPNLSEQFGSIEVICGSMFSGKTEELIRRLKRAQLAKYKVIVFKPFTDNRHENNMIVSHDKNQLKAVTVKSCNEIISHTKGFNVIAIDEAQFFDKDIVVVCNKLANTGFRVIVSGLDMDFKGNPFGSMPDLMAISESVTKLHAVCCKTGKIAHYTYRKDDCDDDLIVIGDKENYEALSREVFYNTMLAKSNKKTKD